MPKIILIYIAILVSGLKAEARLSSESNYRCKGPKVEVNIQKGLALMIALEGQDPQVFDLSPSEEQTLTFPRLKEIGGNISEDDSKMERTFRKDDGSTIVKMREVDRCRADVKSPTANHSIEGTIYLDGKVYVTCCETN